MSIPKNSLGDDSRTANALLYFPSRLNVAAPNESYRWDDNSDYISKDATSARAVFTETRVMDPRRIGPDNAGNPGGILIIGTGANDTYLESDDNDDITNWESR